MELVYKDYFSRANTKKIDNVRNCYVILHETHPRSYPRYNFVGCVQNVFRP